MPQTEVLVRFRVKPLYVREGSTGFGYWTLRKFQEELMDAIGEWKNVQLIAPTGAGKTLSLLLHDKGFVGLYPNNTLLLDQQKSIDKILREALEARLNSVVPGEDADLLRIYELGEGMSLPASDARKVAVILLSGRYIGYERADDGSIVPKRKKLLRDVVDKICYPRVGEKTPYLIVMGTPDTALMIMAGIYRNFEKVGFSLHDGFIAAVTARRVEYAMSKYQVATGKELSDLAMIRQCLLEYPWFIDEYHLYGLYEAKSLVPILQVFKEVAGWDYPLVLSSATPFGALGEELMRTSSFREIKEVGKSEGNSQLLVRGETEVEVVSVDVRGRGIAKWFNVGYEAWRIVKERLGEIKSIAGSGNNVFIVVDRVNQVPQIVQTLRGEGINPECSVSITPPGCAGGETHVLVGSESISQGIDRPNVKLGILTSYNWVSLIQRFGRIGRKTDSKVILLIPALHRKLELDKLDGKSITYNEFVDEVKEIYNENIIKERYNKKMREIFEIRASLLKYLAIIGFSMVSKPGGTFRDLAREMRGRGQILNRFYGPPEIIANLALFRSSGPRVIAEIGDHEENVDLGTVLRNYKILGARREVKEVSGIRKDMLILDISLEPERQKLVIRPGREVKEDLLRFFDGKITTIGSIAGLGFSLFIESWKDYSEVIPLDDLPVDVKQQVVALLSLPQELMNYYVYTGAGAEVFIGENRMLALFL